MVFNNPSRQEFITLGGNERKMLTLFRKMGSHMQKDCLTSLGEIAESRKSTSKLLDKAGKEQRARKEKEKGIEKSPETSARQPKAKRKPGRKKLDKKALQEKIDKLKILMRSINKIKVR